MNEFDVLKIIGQLAAQYNLSAPFRYQPRLGYQTLPTSRGTMAFSNQPTPQQSTPGVYMGDAPLGPELPTPGLSFGNQPPRSPAGSMQGLGVQPTSQGFMYMGPNWGY